MEIKYYVKIALTHLSVASVMYFEIKKDNRFRSVVFF